LGHFIKEKFESDFAKACGEAVKAKAKECVDASNIFSEVFAVKDEQEIDLLQKASEITCNVFTKHLKEKIMDVIDEDRKVSHQSLSDGCQDALKNKDIIKGFEMSNLEMCYDPIIQSGGNYALKFSVESDKKPMHFGTIICSLGVRYRSYCSNVVRTLIVNPTQQQSTYYEYLHDLLNWAISQVTPGMHFSKLYSSIVNKVQSDHSELVDKLPRSFGFATGIEFRDGCQLIGPKSTSVFRKGMSVNVNIGFQDLKNEETEDAKNKVYSLWIGDVVLVGHGDDGSNLILTMAAKRRQKNVFLYVEEEEEEETGGGEDGNTGLTNASKTKVSAANSTSEATKSSVGLQNGGAGSNAEEILGRGHRRAIIEQKTRNEQSAEEKRLQQRRELFQQLQINARNRLTGIKNDGELGQKAKSNVAYKGAGQMPKEDDVRKLRIFVGQDFNFLILSGTFVSKLLFFSRQNPQSTFLKEMTYRASNQRHHGDVASPSTNLNNAYRIIKEVLKRFRSREAEERERANLVEQDVLVVDPVKSPFRLRDLYIRPNIVTKRITGTLEAHSNGFRFTSIRGDKVDILYNNIKHSFYQPCDGEMIILLHFHLKNAIMYGKKKQTDIQFYTEVGELTTDLGKTHSRMHDRDDLEAEQREREMREQIKNAFKSFVDRAEALAKRYNLEFEIPFRDLGFFGCPLRSTVLLMPTSSCLVSLVEWPPFVVTLDEVELVHFERVSLSIRTFDMVFVFKDYRAKPAMVNSIPSSALDHVKEWVMSCDIFYSEGAKSLNWPKLMKTIVDNPEDFLEQNGWSFLSPDDDDEGEEDDADSQEEDENYEPSVASSASDGEGSGSVSDEDDEDEDWEAEEDSTSEGSLDSDESEGKNWDQLEEEALREDRKLDAREVDEVPTSKRRRSPSPSSRSKKPRPSSAHSKDRRKHH
uniref:FACT complex subunit n=1 Tax=Schistocephalus solidus TaxID=70667 RepID=A0A183SSW0_SCHSO